MQKDFKKSSSSFLLLLFPEFCSIVYVYDVLGGITASICVLLRFDLAGERKVFFSDEELMLAKYFKQQRDQCCRKSSH